MPLAFRAHCNITSLAGIWFACTVFMMPITQSHRLWSPRARGLLFSARGTGRHHWASMLASPDVCCAHSQPQNELLASSAAARDRHQIPLWPACALEDPKGEAGPQLPFMSMPCPRRRRTTEPSVPAGVSNSVRRGRPSSCSKTLGLGVGECCLHTHRSRALAERPRVKLLGV